MKRLVRGRPSSHQEPIFLAGMVLLLCLFIWSGWEPEHRLSWIMHALPVALVCGLLFPFHSQLERSPRLLLAIWAYLALLLWGARYSYSQTPGFAWIQHQMGLEQNPFDRLLHFLQGAIPALLFQDLFLRWNVIKNARWLFWMSLCVALGLSAGYEIFEAIVAQMVPTRPTDFTLANGNVWDTQWDMAMALVGAAIALWLLGEKEAPPND